MTVMQFLTAGLGVVALRALWLISELHSRHQLTGWVGRRGNTTPQQDA